MSSSRHPVALRLERALGLREAVSGPAKLLAIVMFLPLIDGIFPALILAGGIDSVAGILQVGLLVFGGSAVLAVILAEMDDAPKEQMKVVLLVAAGLIPLAALEATLAPTIASVIDLAIFERFAALVIVAIAAKTASARIGEYLPSPAVIVGLGFVASVDPSGFEVVVLPDPALVGRAVAAAGVGVAFALVVALASPWLRQNLDIDSFRFGSAVALGVLPLALLGVVFEQAPLAVLIVAGVLAFDPADGIGGPAPDGAAADGGTDEERNGSDRGQAPEREREPWL
ncbi:DUF5794 domain-containing protein [Halalkalicoccus jeotgali]|uniref:Uncharacterized protein n=1 Tax=Halalkalicoccus jeotgali (strain DSM 18796 / CECT 7217 / JCM 14584 / KCTC 4019 / B3) TaxID=795797 RepID=D8J3H3_HALJB|nr:DUF5794 domain-containing protein [Halalkalicoccus jeotgali]ADJ15280.1 hypothetical protein HacjB3_09485 [Halalkalicoccus jeotgali B3]ELY35299.1 hypothetical protein C497_13191 [Halalkalicoccus jeotgali B3]